VTDYIAVAPHKRVSGVERPGTRKRDRSGKLVEFTYDWRAPRGDDRNTRRIVPAFTTAPLVDALAVHYDTDAHLVTYYVVGHDGRPLERQPRVNKSALDWIMGEGYAVECGVLFCDVDHPGHGTWTPARVDAFEQLWHSADVLATAGCYFTAHGYRLLQLLDEPVSVADVEPMLDTWLAELTAAGIDADPHCRDWTRLYRLPHVIRAGAAYESPRVDLSRMSPRLIPKLRPGAPGAGGRLAA